MRKETPTRIKKEEKKNSSKNKILPEQVNTSLKLNVCQKNMIIENEENQRRTLNLNIILEFAVWYLVPIVYFFLIVIYFLVYASIY